jgi:hypothetical protein
MKKIIKSFFVAILVANATFAQTGEEVLEKYIKAIGGREAIAKIKDVSSVMSAEIQGTKIEIVSKIKEGNKSLQITNVDGMGEMSKQICNGTKVAASAQGQEAPAIEGDMLKLSIMRSAVVPEMEFLNAKLKMTVLGTEKVGDADAVKVEMDGVAMKWVDFYDVTSGLKVKNITKLVSPMGEMEIISTFSDYKAFSGVLMPTKMKNETPMFSMDLTPTYEINKGIDDSVFEIK